MKNSTENKLSVFLNTRNAWCSVLLLLWFRFFYPVPCWCCKVVLRRRYTARPLGKEVEIHCIISARKHQAKACLSTCSAGIITASEVPKHLLVEALSQLNCHCPLCHFPTIRAQTGRVTLTQNEQSLGITSGTLSGFCLLCESTILVVQPFEEIWILKPTLTFKHLFQNKHAF